MKVMSTAAVFVAVAMLLLSIPALATTFYGGDVGPTIDVDAASYSPPVATVQSSSYSSSSSSSGYSGSASSGSYYSSASGGYSVSGSYLPSYYSYTPYYSGYWPSYGQNPISPYAYYSYPYYYGYTGPFLYYYYPSRNAQNSVYVSYATSGSDYYARLTYSSAEQANPPADIETVQTPQAQVPQPLNSRAAWLRR